MSVALINANALHIPLANESVNCIVTSPPYYGLRDYGTAQWEGGDPECDHTYAKGGRSPETSSKQISNAGTTFSQYEKVCKRCSARRIDNQIGLEETPEQYVQKMVEVFREVWRVLKPDGTVWLNLGDSYWGGKGQSGYELPDEAKARRAKGETLQNAHNVPGTRNMRPTDGKHEIIKPKDLIGIPWLVAFALRADGWYLRSDIVWHKPNPMPESVTDRPTKSHEYIFLLTKSAQYFYDAQAIAEPVTQSSIARLSQNIENQVGSTRANGGAKTNGNMKAVIKNLQPNDNQDTQYAGRNKRSVWTVATAPYSGAHFATYPPALIEPCIKAGCPEGGIVLDPFSGSGTTAMVARKLNRHGIGLDLSLTYIRECARPRLQLSALDEFTNGKKAESNHSDLPLFMDAQ